MTAKKQADLAGSDNRYSKKHPRRQTQDHRAVSGRVIARKGQNKD